MSNTKSKIPTGAKHPDSLQPLRDFNERRQKRSIEARELLISYFENFAAHEPAQITNALLSVQLEHWQYALRGHPGYKTRDTLNALLRIKKLIVHTVIEMHQHYDSFQERERANQSPDENERERITDLVLKELVCFVALGSSLVAIARRFKSSRPEIAEAVEDNLQAFFAPPVSHFVKCLRNNHQHIRFHPTHWEISKEFGPPPIVSAKFFLDSEELLQTGDDWDETARTFLASQKRLDPHEIASWAAPGSEDTELGVLMELEVGHGEAKVYRRVQA